VRIGRFWHSGWFRMWLCRPLRIISEVFMTAAQKRNLSINYLEFVVVDIARAKAFYGSAFGWTFTD
jgi:hypothetical protein